MGVRLPLSRETPSLWEGFIVRSPEATSTKEDVLSWLLRLLSDDGRFVFCVDAIGFADGKPLFEVARGDTTNLM
jgi:hypothetical protein